MKLHKTTKAVEKQAFVAVKCRQSEILVSTSRIKSTSGFSMDTSEMTADMKSAVKKRRIITAIKKSNIKDSACLLEWCWWASFSRQLIGMLMRDVLLP